MSRNPVILLHGIDDTSFLLRQLRQFLEERTWEVHALDFSPNDGSAGLDELAAQVHAYLQSTFPRARKIDLIGFSMGGLVARFYVQRLAEPGRVQRLITISSPHNGTWTAYLRRNPPTAADNNAGARQMRPGSAFLRGLEGHREALSLVQFTSIWTPLDLMIVPASSSVMQGARIVQVRSLAHPLMVRDSRTMKAVRDALLLEQAQAG
jgi:triacylglycerol lipase